MAGVIFEHVYKFYGGEKRAAVEDFHLEVEDGEFLVMLGPSGCGKSTTLRMLAGLEDVTKGSIYIGGKFSNYISPKNRDIAMVFQNYALYPNMNVRENLSLGLKMRKTAKHEIELKINRVARILEISHLLDKRPHELSGGQKQRVALGRAIVREPQVFLMDEPLSNLDAKLRERTRTEIIQLHQQLKTTTIYVTHDQTEALTMGTRIVVMRDGKIQQVSPPQDMYDFPANLFVASFIGSPQMNFIDGAAAERDGAFYFENRRQSFRVPAYWDRRFREAPFSALHRLVLGIRPENVHVGAHYEAMFPDWITNAAVETVERMGSDTYLHLSAGNLSFVARVDAHAEFRVKENVRAVFNLNKAIFFDGNTEQSLHKGARAG